MFLSPGSRAGRSALRQLAALELPMSSKQQAQARTNVYAAPFDALAYNGLQTNGSMEIDQANAGGALSSISAGRTFAIDTWAVTSAGSVVVTSQQVSDAPAGYNNSLKFSVTTADSSPAAGDYLAFEQRIEGTRCARLAFGGANAQSVSIGFWVKANRTGTYGGALRNSAISRSYPFTFVINNSATWEFKTITIPGDTTGTWLNAVATIGLSLTIAMGCGATYAGSAGAWSGSSYVSATGCVNGMAATSDYMQLTGVIVLPGIELPSSSRAPFIMRPADSELLLCMRQYYKLVVAYGTPIAAGAYQNGTTGAAIWPFPVPQMASPSTATSAASTFSVLDAGSYVAPTAISFASVSLTAGNITITVASATGGQGLVLTGGAAGYIVIASRL